MERQSILIACAAALLLILLVLPRFGATASQAHAASNGGKLAFHPANDQNNGSCGAHRSPLQRSVDRAYHAQRRRLDSAIAAFQPEELDSFGTRQAWRIWECYPPIYNCPDKQKLGSMPEDGGKFVCGVSSYLQHPDCVVLSIGSRGEQSFEKDIVRETPCAVHTFDPTLDEGQRAQLAQVQEVVIHDYGLGPHDAHTTLNDRPAELKSLPSILAELGLRWVDVLKIDIEGGEWAVLEQLLQHYGHNLPFSQLLIEMHFTPPADARRALRILRGLEEAGLRVFSFEYNFYAQEDVAGFLEYSFVNVKDCRVLV